jgi:hypothetical protein
LFCQMWCDGPALCSVVLSPADNKPRLHVHLCNNFPVSMPAEDSGLA